MKNHSLVKTLPKLPIPSLELTLQNFKLATTAFLTDEEFETVSEACKELEGASGSAIQRYLLDRQEKHDNWAYDWWLEDMYLKNSLPLPIHSNPGMIFPRETFKTTEEFIRYVSCFVEEAYKFKIKIDRNLIPQDRASSRERNQPLCMLQYQRIFSSYRESGYSKDNLLEYEPNNNSHFIVAAKGQFFVVQYMTEKSTLSFEDLYLELAQIYKSSQQQQEKVGLLTAAERRHSATLFENLMKDKQNNDNVCTIRSAAFIICLDDNPGTDSESGRMAQMIHGGGVSKNSTNRWFNKTMQFIFSESGSCGLCYEHSPAEGIVVVQMVEDILKNCAERESGKIHLVENRTAKIPKKLIWKLEKCLQQEIDNIGTELDREMENLDVLIHTYDGYGKELVKKNSISPDVFIQVVLQLTYYRLVFTYNPQPPEDFGLTKVSSIWFSNTILPLSPCDNSDHVNNDGLALPCCSPDFNNFFCLNEKLMKLCIFLDKQNNDNVCTIRSAAFIICLDDNPGTDSESGRMAQMIHGGGVSKNSTNRWFNKTMQFIFSESGSCGLCYEHSPAEGIVVVQMVEDILKNCAERESGKIHLVENRTAKIPKKLIWKLEKCLQQEIDNIGTELDREMENLDVLIHTYDGYGKELVKKISISPDVFIQVVLQLTYYRIYGRLGATYESASTRRFRKGRVDCIRAATPEALEWVKAMTSEGALNEERLSKFKRAVNAQTEIMTDNILGRGIDIHLMGIKEAAKELGIKLSLFDSPAFKKANHFCLSTSQITTRLDTVMGYGPVVPEGHGVSYNIQRESFKFCISSFKSFESASSKTFAESLDESLNRVQQLLLSQNFINRTSLV
ncbi:choline O-acetyltransferase-like [Artemia franciscana]|uniref:choline O-acetyltransferase-like n=1 Tax=Artemia franciscana TaxID=6661 RepID=UPI0032DBB8BB